MNQANQVIVTSPAELRDIVNQAVQSAISRNSAPADDARAWGWDECADYLGVSPNTLRGMVDAGQIPFFSIPSTGKGLKRIIRFHPAKIRAWEGEGNHPLSTPPDLSTDPAMVYRRRKSASKA